MAINYDRMIDLLRRINSSACSHIHLAEAHRAAKHNTAGVETTMSAADRQAMLTAYQSIDSSLQAAIVDYNSIKP